MGFDIECIIDIHTYPGEFFCPVCRTLVYPNEALQSQCTHLYCKPCLAHVANGSRACPYDGYLVTESESKPLIESDKALADKIGKVKVHCLFHRSGCTWEGPLSECTSHCSGCTFGNSPVICNRCGVQIVHRQVHDHAQSCPGVYQTQQTAENAQGAASLGPASTTTAADSNQTAAQPGALTSQAQNPQSTAAALLPGQDLNHQVNPNFQAPTGATTAVPTPEQWYQQQYQQYYQQYAGYDPHQQSYHQYYPNQQQPVQQYQQNSLHMQGQHQSQAHAQPQQPQIQMQPQSQVQPQLHPQTQPPQPQPNVQPQHQSQPQPHPQPSLQPQTQSQSQVPAQGQQQMHAPVPAPGHQINPLQQLHPAMQSQAQVLTQTLSAPPGQSAPQPVPYPQGQTLPVSMRPPVQQQQMPQYSQPQSLMYYTQASQVQHPPQIQPQPQLQPHLPAQPLAHLQHPPQSHPQLRPQLNQPSASTPHPQVLHPTAPAVTGHHSYPLPHPAQQVQSGALQQHPMHPYPNGSLPPAHIHGQVSQQPAFVRPPHSHGQLPQQQASTVFPPQGQVSSIPPAQQQQFQPQSQQPVHQIQHMPVMQPVRHTVPQQPFLAAVQSQLQQHGHFVQQQQPPQPQLLMMQQNVAVPQGSLPLQPKSNVRRPAMDNHVIPPQSFPQSSAGFGAAQLRPVQPNLNQPSTNQSYARSVVLERPEELENHETSRGVGSSPENIMRKDFKVLGTDADVKYVTSETVQNNDQKYIGEMVDESGQNRTVDKDAAEDGAGSSLNSSDGKLVET
ncbi:chromatin modification-related protein eaf-1-like, partial [Olea europaea var. sylvestris]|uniref:chromatin modification-related protein eaf-1-like n=1 Tax=Olea europaea var. sylvestris TaxID=158386 RepID=UPI000C1D1640